MRLLHVLILTLVCCFPTTSATARSWSSFAACQAAQDRAICLLRVAGEEHAGSRLYWDLDLNQRPDLLGAAGFRRADFETWRAAEETGPHRSRYSSSEKATEAVGEVLALEAAGRNPEQSLAPVMVLKSDPPSSPAVFPGCSMRLLAFQLLGDRAATPGLANAVLRAWETELASIGGIADDYCGPLALANAYRRLGDEAGIDRSIALMPPTGDADKISLLARAGRFEAAAELSESANLEPIVAMIRKKITASKESERRFRELFTAESTRHLQAVLEDLRASGRSEEADRLALELAKPPHPAEEEEEEEPDEIDEAMLRGSARSELDSARLELMTLAEAGGRLDVARAVADALIRASDPAAPVDVASEWAPTVVSAASPGLATAWVARLETIPPARDDTVSATISLQSRVYVVGECWRRLGQRDRLDAWIARWRPTATEDAKAWRKGAAASDMSVGGYAFAVANILLNDDRVSEAAPLLTSDRESTLLLNDLRRGRSVVNLERYLREVGGPAEQRQLLGGCPATAIQARDFDSVAECLRRLAALSMDAGSRSSVSSQLIAAAATAGQAGNPTAMRKLLALAFEVSRGLPDASDAWATPQALSLIEIAKAELRADGRLPPLAPSSER